LHIITRTIYLPENLGILLDAANLQPKSHRVENLVEVNLSGRRSRKCVCIIPELEHVSAMMHFCERVGEHLVEFLRMFQSFRIDFRRECISRAFHTVGISCLAMRSGGRVLRTAGSGIGLGTSVKLLIGGHYSSSLLNCYWGGVTTFINFFLPNITKNYHIKILVEWKDQGRPLYLYYKNFLFVLNN
jgi:hypothetical protein